MRIRSTLFGYSKEDVRFLVSRWRHRTLQLQQEIQNRDIELEQYKKELADLRKTQTIATDALKDARNIANNILVKAEREAKRLMDTTEAFTERQLSNSREDIRQLDDIKRNITRQEAIMRQELLRLLEQHRLVIENFNLSTFQHAANEVDRNVAASDNVVQNSKIRVILPSQKNQEDTPKDNGNTIPIYALK